MKTQDMMENNDVRERRDISFGTWVPFQISFLKAILAPKFWLVIVSEMTP